jgi:phospholipid/cholesterol/gamma-HCH transport system substrate-binding protein
VRLRLLLRRSLSDIVPLILLAAIAAGAGGYILAHQRLRFPVLEEQPIRMKIELPTAQAVTPGQGQTVRVSGVQVGVIGEVKLVEGHAIVNLEIDKKYEGLIREDATALLRPKTGLKDMFLEVEPGEGRPLGEGDVIPLANTVPDVTADQILAMLDADTRDYIQLLVAGAGRGLQGRGRDLREIYRLFEPTHRDLARVNSAVATRRQELRRLINSLERLSGELAGKEVELAQLVDSAARVFRAYASEDRNISAAVRELPGALRQATDTLGRVERLARVLGPASENLRPAARALGRSNVALRPLAREAAPLLRHDIRPFVRESRPFVRELRPAAQNLASATPNFTRTFRVLNRFFNMLAFNPRGREGPEVRDRHEGYLFWLAWLPHNSAATFSTADAHGPFRPSLIAGSCSAFRTVIGDRPEAEFALNLTSLLTDPELCGEAGTAKSEGNDVGAKGGARRGQRRAKSVSGEATIVEGGAR